MSLIVSQEVRINSSRLTKYLLLSQSRILFNMNVRLVGRCSKDAILFHIIKTLSCVSYFYMSSFLQTKSLTKRWHKIKDTSFASQRKCTISCCLTFIAFWTQKQTCVDLICYHCQTSSLRWHSGRSRWRQDADLIRLIQVHARKGENGSVVLILPSVAVANERSGTETRTGYLPSLIGRHTLSYPQLCDRVF